MRKQKLLLNDRTLRALKPAPVGQRYVIWDAKDGFRGFGCLVTDRGHRSFIVFRRVGARNVRLTLGAFPELSLASARELARKALDHFARGADPRDRERRERQAQARQRADTFATVAESFLKTQNRLRTAHEIATVIRRDLISRWGTRPIREITRRDVLDMLAEVIARGEGKRRGQVSYAAHHALANGRKLFNWAVEHEIIEISPTDRIKAVRLIGPKEKRKRVLTDRELQLYWQVTQWMLDGEHRGLGYPLAPFARLLLITGQRLRELADARWREVDEAQALLTIRAERMKNKATQEVPLPPIAMELLASVPRFEGGDFIFTTVGGRRPVSGFSKMKLRIDAAMIRLHRRALGVPETDGDLRQALGLKHGEPIPAEYTIENWSFHDIRRTMRTRLSALPIADKIAELMIGHAQSGLHQIYDQHRHTQEKRRGFVLWQNALLATVEPERSNVPIREPAAAGRKVVVREIA